MKNYWNVVIKIISACIIIVILSADNTTLNYINENKLLESILQFVLFFLITKILTTVSYYAYCKKQKIEVSKKDNFYFGINNISNVLIFIAFVIFLFKGFGIELKTLLTSLSIVAAAIAIIAKDYITDFLVGIYFSFSRNIEIDDYVKIGNHKGKIIEIEILKIKLLNDNEDLVILPNVMVYSNEIINYTKSMINTMSVDFQLDISIIEEIETIEDGLKNELKEFHEFIELNSFQLKIIELKKDHIDFKILYKLKSLDVELQKKIRRKTIRKIYNYVLNKLKDVDK